MPRAQKWERKPVSSSSIQTLLSVPELHRFGAFALADFTAGGESHPALKNPYELDYNITCALAVVKILFLW